MEDNIFKAGQEIEAIYWPNNSSITLGKNGVEKITVVMENGQMAEVTWFAVWRNGVIADKHNASYVEGVKL